MLLTQFSNGSENLDNSEAGIGLGTVYQGAAPAIFPREWLAGKGLVQQLWKAVGPTGEIKRSNRTTLEGTYFCPFNVSDAKSLARQDPYHSSAVTTKLNRAFGKGFSNKATVKKLNELTSPKSFHHVFMKMGHDYFSTGNGFFEVVRLRSTHQVVAIHFLPSECVSVYVEPDKRGFHYEISDSNIEQAWWPEFGDFERFIIDNPHLEDQFRGATYSEVWHLQEPTSHDEYFGVPNWLAAAPSIQLLLYLRQDASDYLINRTLLQMLYALESEIGKVPDDDIKKLQAKLQEMGGLGQNYQSLVIGLSAGVSLNAKPLANREGHASEYSTQQDAFAREILAAHNVPAFLAGARIGGSLGASSQEEVAEHVFIETIIEPNQCLTSDLMTCTFGSPESGLGLSGDDAFEMEKAIASSERSASKTGQEGDSQGQDGNSEPDNPRFLPSNGDPRRNIG